GDVGRDVEPPHRGDHVATDILGDLTHAAHDVGGGHEGVVTDAHGRGASVVLDAGEGHAGPGDGHDAFHHAHGEALLLEDGPLLDVELEIGAQRAGDARLGAEIADALELVAQAHPVAITRVVGVLQGNLTCHHPGADHGGLKARALLVGEDGHGNRVPRA